MRNAWGVMAGLGMAGLLVAAAPTQAQSGTTSSSTSGTDSSSSYGQPSSKSKSHGSATTGDTGTSGSTSSQSQGSMGSSLASASSNEVTGKVEKFDKSKNELTLRLKLSDSAQVMKDGKTASLSDIKPGDEVRASFSGTGDTLQVNRIDVLSGSPSSPGSSGSMGSPDTGSSTSPSGADTSGTGSSSSKGSRGY